MMGEKTFHVIQTTLKFISIRENICWKEKTLLHILNRFTILPTILRRAERPKPSHLTKKNIPKA